MKTKDFIKMLQQEDPTGEGYLRLPGGIPLSVEAKEGYWDGAYDFIDEEGNWVHSINHYKVDLCCIDIIDFVGDLYNHHDPTCTLDYIKSKFKFELGGYSIESQRNDKKQRVYKEVEEAYNLHKKIQAEFLTESIQTALEREKAGWRFYQNKKVYSDIGYKYYSWKLIDPLGNSKSSSAHDTNAILHSGLFERLDNNQIEGYYEWIIKKGVKV